MHFGFHNATVHSCPRKCGILHANFQPFKCVAKMMQASPSCATWQAFQKRLAKPFDPQEPCPRVSVGQRLTFKRAISKFFDSCCVEDGLASDGWPRPRGRRQKLAHLLT